MSSHRTFVGRATVLTGLVLWMCAGFAAYAQVVTEFEVPSARCFLAGIAAGPDGSLWFTEWSANKIGRITTDGVITEFKLPGLTNPGDIASGSDGSLWFTRSTWSSWENGGPYRSPPMIGRITTAGVVSEFPIPHSAHGIVAGPDGALWFGEEGVAKIGRITTGGVVTEFSTRMDGSVGGIAAGPDGALWFTQLENDKIGRMTMDGGISEFKRAGAVRGYGSSVIVSGGDGRLWFDEGAGPAIRQITAGGVISEYPIPKSVYGARGMALGSDGNIWFTESQTIDNKIGRITPKGVVTLFDIPTAGSDTWSIVAGSDGALWFLERHGNKIGRITTGRYDGSPAVVSRQ
jgi:streptogramin lyase